MAFRFVGDFKSEQGTVYIVGIWDDDFVGTQQSIVIQDAEITLQSEGKDRFSPILGSSARVKVLIETADHETMIEDIVGAPEGRFSMRILIGLQMYFVGYIMPDLITVDNSKREIAYTLELTATDALARLKTIDYNDNGTPYDGYQTFTQHIFNCLNKLPGITGLYSGAFLNAYILKVVVEWSEDTWTYSATRPVFDEARVHHRAFYSRDAKGNYKHLSCYDVLARICEAWGMRMMFSDGCFWMIQIPAYVSPTDVVIFQYEADQTLATDASEDISVVHNQANPETTGIVELAGGVYKFFPPLKDVKVRYNHIATINLLGNQSWGVGGVGASVTYDDVGAGGLGRLVFEATLTASTLWGGISTPDFQPHWLLFSVTLQVGSYYLKRVATFSGGSYSYDNQDGVWTTTPSVFHIVAQEPITQDGQLIFPPVGFITPTLIEDGDLLFAFDYTAAYDFSGNDVTLDVAADVTFSLSSPYLELLYLGTFSGQNDILEYSATNDTAGNSERIELSTFIGDGPTTTSPGHIQILDGVDWVKSDAWTVGGSGTAKPHSQLLANEIIAGQLTPIRRKLCTFYNVTDVLHPHSAVSDTVNSRTYVLQGGTWLLGKDEINGEWFEIKRAAGFSEVTVEAQPSDEPSVESPSGTGSSGVTTIVQGAGSITKVFAEEFTGTATDTFTITANGGTLPTNEAAITVYWNGQWTNQWTVSGSNIVMDFSLRADDYLNVIFLIS